MRIPSDATVAETKLTDYLLVRRPWDDKSEFLHRAGFGLENWPALREAVMRLAESVEAVEDGGNEYGTFYRVEGALTGPTGTLQMVSIWMKRTIDQGFHFVTLKPSRAKER